MSSSNNINELPTILWYSPQITNILSTLIPPLKYYDPYETTLFLICIIGMTLSLLILINRE